MIKATDIKDFQAEVFCITGSIPHWSRSDLFTQIEVRDGEYVDRMTKSVTVLVYGYRTGSKIDKAIQYGTKLMEWREFLTLLAMTPVVDTEKAKCIQSIYDGTPRKYLGGAHVVQPMEERMIWGHDNKNQSVSDEGLAVSDDLKPETLNLEPLEPVSSSEAITPSEAVTSPLTSEPKAVTPTSDFSWRELVSGIAAVFIILVKGLAVVCGLAICVCLWLVGIPAKP